MVKLVRNTIKSKFTYYGRQLKFYGICLWVFVNSFARNDVIFGVNNSLSSHTENQTNKFLTRGEELTDGINGSTGSVENKINTNFSKAKSKFCLSLHYDGDDSYLYINKTDF